MIDRELLEAPAGWKLVPIEPTDEMSAAGIHMPDASNDPDGVYRAMLAVAPLASCTRLRPIAQVESLLGEAAAFFERYSWLDEVGQSKLDDNLEDLLRRMKAVAADSAKEEKQ